MTSSSQESGSDAKQRKKSVRRYYAFLVSNYIIDIIFLVVVVIGAGVLETVVRTPVKRKFFLNDLSISYPFAEETVPAWLLFVLVAATPIVVILLSQLFIRNLVDLFTSVLGLLESGFATFLFVNYTKIITGRLRPDFLARCQPDTNLECTGNPEDVEDGRLSFPSQHAATAFAGLGFLALYLLGKLRTFKSHKKEYYRHGNFWHFVPCAIPLGVAVWISVTRYTDYKHHPSDIFVGAAIGSAFAYLCYRLHYPPVTAKYSNMPLVQIAKMKRKRRQLKLQLQQQHELGATHLN
eukprot:GEZU01026784.1.p2 GENE.GEZU01026784.1~~GEZU01026784.1.p2  ORF type:complete len:294 (+),score=43.55 GEZU01026784.1:1611-2492(+)